MSADEPRQTAAIYPSRHTRFVSEARSRHGRRAVLTFRSHENKGSSLSKRPADAHDDDRRICVLTMARLKACRRGVRTSYHEDTGASVFIVHVGGKRASAGSRERFDHRGSLFVGQNGKDGLHF